VDPPDQHNVELLTAEADNLRAALRTAVDSAAIEDGMWLAVAMSILWFVRGTCAEGRVWLNELLALPEGDSAPVARAHALGAAGHLAACQGDYAAAEQLLARARPAPRHEAPSRARRRRRRPLPGQYHALAR
jgi:hypothetical protein